MPKSPIVDVKVLKRFPHDKSHHNLLSSKVGTITPLLCDEIIPGTKIYQRIALSVTMPPLASETYMNVKYKVRAFFCPMRLLCGSFESWFNDREEKYINYSAGANVLNKASGYLPQIVLDASNETLLSPYFAQGTLSDYLGFRQRGGNAFTDGNSISLNPLPWVCYHKIYDDWFRAPQVTESIFAKIRATAASSTNRDYCFGAGISSFFFVSGNYSITPASLSPLLFTDGKTIFDLRQANYGFDYFTNALPSPQNGSGMSVSVGAGSTFTIAALRAANSLQMFQERNDLAGARFVDNIKARYGASLADGVAQRSLYLGGADYIAYSKGVQVNSGADWQAGSNVPFTSTGKVGSTLGKVYASGTDVIIDGFVANEPGYLMVVGYLAPQAVYATGIRKYLTRYTGGAGTIAEMANPMLQNTGMDAVLVRELGDGANDSVFGFVDRFADFMNYESECHGLFGYGESLDSFCLKRYINAATISSSFLQIPTTALDDVLVYSGDKSFGYWVDMDFEYKVAQPLYPYSLPSLMDPAYEHGKTVKIHRGGFRF